MARCTEYGTHISDYFRPQTTGRNSRTCGILGQSCEPAAAIWYSWSPCGLIGLALRGNACAVGGMYRKPLSCWMLPGGAAKCQTARIYARVANHWESVRVGTQRTRMRPAVWVRMQRSLTWAKHGVLWQKGCQHCWLFADNKTPHPPSKSQCPMKQFMKVNTEARSRYSVMLSLGAVQLSTECTP